MSMFRLIVSALVFLIIVTVPARATTLFVNPGPVGGQANNFSFGNSDPAVSVDILWSDNKTLEWEGGPHLFFIYSGNCAFYTGFLLDAAGNEIPDTELAGRAICPAGSDLSAGVIDLPAATVFSGIRLTSAAFASSGGWQWNWKSDDRPVVGQRDASGNQPPVADTGGPYVGVAGTPITFDASDSFDQDGTITAYNWDFGDDISLGGEIIDHTYASAGVYNVTLTVTDDMGASQSRNTIASIGNFSLRPTAEAGGPYSSDTSTSVQFDGSGSSDPDGTIDRYTWNFGDGSPPISGLAAPQKLYGEPGRYTVVLEVEDNTGNTDIDVAEVFISDGNRAPIADAGPPVVGETGVAVAFDASGSNDPDGAIDRYDWDYGDGNSGPDAGATPNHTYTVAGDYTVTVTVTDDLGAVDTDTTSASIDPPSTPPMADAGGPYSALVGVEVLFDGTGSDDAQGPIETYEWDFGDGSMGSGAQPSYTYATEGNFTVTLRVTDGDGLTDTDTAQASIAIGNEPPTADPNGPYSGVAGVPVDFDGSGSSDPEGGITQYDWDFGDSNSAIDGGATPSNTYATAGVYQVALTVFDEGNLDNTQVTSVTIDAANEPPVADANGPYTGTAGTAVDFDGSASSDADGTVATYAWDFGDGETGTGEMPSHTYAAAGTYDVTLTVTDDDGATSPETFSTAAIDSPNVPPVADAGGPYPGKLNVELDFDGGDSSDSDGSVTRYDWDFGDGNVANDGGPNPTNTYAATGLYDVVLTVTDDDGATAKSATQALIGDGVNLPPAADPGGPYAGEEGIAVSFDGSGSGDPDGSIVAYAWEFGDGATGTGATPSHTYAAAGNYPVTLTVTDDGGAEAKTNTATTTAAINMGNQPPTAEAGGPYPGLVDTEIFFNGSGSTDPDGGALSATWDFGDGNNATGLAVNHTYTSSGLYRATLTVTDPENASDSDSTLVVVSVGNAPPVADAGGPYEGTADTALTFDGSASSDSDGSISDYDWEFGDTDTGTGETVDHTYTSAGTYNVILQVTDNGGLVASDNATATVGAASSPPTADAGGPYSGTINVAISFDASASSDPDGSIVRYDWDYGDGDTDPDAGATPSHTYTRDGKFVVKVTVTDDTDEVASDSAIVTVAIGNQPPSADAGPVVSGPAGTSVSFDGSASSDPDGNIVTYAWDFGDGSTGTGPNPTHVYGIAGDYNVTLTVTDDRDAVSSDVTAATVTTATTASLGVQSKSKGSSFGIFGLVLFFVLLVLSRVPFSTARSNLVVVLVGVMMFAAAETGHAEEIKWYAGIGVGSSSADYSDNSDFVQSMANRGHTVTNLSIDDRDTGYKIYGGLNWGKYLGAELGYVDLGETKASFDVVTGDPAGMVEDANELLPVLGSGFALSALGRYPFGDRGALFARLGVYSWEAENSISTTGDVDGSSKPDSDGTDPVFGLGGDLYFPNVLNGTLGARLEWERYALDPNDVDFVSVSLLLRF